MVYCLLLSLFIGKVWAPLMLCLLYLITFRILDAGMGLISFSSTLVQPSIECHSGLLFKFKSIGAGGSVLSICPEFLSYRRQRVVVDGAASEWIQIISVVPQGRVLGIVYTSWYPILYIMFRWYPIYQRNV